MRKSPAACRLRCTHTRAAAQVVETRSTRSIVQTAAAAESLQGLHIVLSSVLKPLLPRCNLCCIAAHRRTFGVVQKHGWCRGTPTAFLQLVVKLRGCVQPAEETRFRRHCLLSTRGCRTFPRLIPPTPL